MVVQSYGAAVSSATVPRISRTAASNAGQPSPPARAPSSSTRADAEAVARVVPSLLRWYACHARDLPWRRTTDPYGIWISEVMLQQTRVETVRSFWERWTKRLPTLDALARARPDTVLKLWEGLGYYRRARDLQAAARAIQRDHQGRFPRVREELLQLPGIGPYTAGAICSIAYNQPTPVLDGNVIRVLTRLRGIRTDPRGHDIQKRLWSMAEVMVRHAGSVQRSGQRSCGNLNQALMELGATVCLPRAPRCELCPIRSKCAARAQAATHRIPALPLRLKPIERRVAVLTVNCGGRFLVQRRPAGTVNSRLWEFPSFPLDGDSAPEWTQALRALGISCSERSDPWLTLQHSITRYRFLIQVHRAEAERHPCSDRAAERWCTPSELDGLPMSAAHRKIVRNLVRTLSSELPSAPSASR
jgi:A/G-specific adenine glycosylase